VAPILFIVAIVVADAVLPPTVHLGPLLAVAPALTAMFAGPWTTGFSGLLALLALLFAGRLRGGLSTLNHQVQISALVLITCFLVIYCLLRDRRRRELAQVRSVSEAAQRVVLRPIPARLGPLRVASVYVAAAAEARIGGDLYAAARNDGATRLLIGDVRGKGLAAISDAAVALCAFYEAAHRCVHLATLVSRLEESVARNLAELTDADTPHAVEFFITAAVAEVPDDEPVVRMISRGHPPPLVLRGRRVLKPRFTDPAPPLGMTELITSDQPVETLPFRPGDLLVLYTDGVIEARNRAGAFYPLTERLASWQDGDPETLVRHLRDDLLAYVGGRLPDDAAVVVVERADEVPAVGTLRELSTAVGGAEGGEGVPGAGGQLQVEVRVRVGQVVAGDLADPAQAILQRAAVDRERRRRRLVAAPALQVAAQRLHQLRPLTRVVVEQVSEPLAHEALDRRRLAHAGEQPVHPQPVELRGLVVARDGGLEPKREPGLVVGARQVQRPVVRPADADPAQAAAEFPAYGLAEARPRPVGVGQHDHLPAPYGEQRADPRVPHRRADGAPEPLVDRAADDDHPVRSPQVVAEGVGAGQHGLLAGAGQQLLDQVASEAQLGLGDVVQVGEFEAEDGRGVLEGDAFWAAGRLARVDQGEQAEDVVARARRDDEAALAAQGPG
jgi:serine phosphatase RsbU (regulator of sigma subunit)